MIVETDFLDHWKTQLLRDRLGGDIAVIVLLRLWAHCQIRKTNRFSLSPDALKAVCRWPGPSDKLLASLLEAGFLDKTDQDGTFLVHDWEKTNVSLMKAWENGAKGGRPKTSESYSKPANNPPITGRFPSGLPADNPAATGGNSIDRLDRGDREDGGRKPTPTNLFPEDGIPFQVSSELNRLAPSLCATPAMISAGPFAISRLQHMPLVEWFHATQELCAYLNCGGELKHGKNWLTTLTTYLQNRYERWNNSGRSEDGSPETYPKNNGAARSGESTWAGVASRQATDPSIPPAIAANLLARRTGKHKPALPVNGTPAA